MPPPKPKIPAEYANKASAEFTNGLKELAAGLNDSLESRTASLGADAMSTVEHAGVFARTENGVTPDVKSPADFSVGLDELLQGFKAEGPKEVTGSGAKTVSVLRDENNRPKFKYQHSTGVLNSQAEYTPNNVWPTRVDLENPTNGRTFEAGMSNLATNMDRNITERADFDNPHKLFSEGLERIPGVVPPLAAAGVAGIALTAKPAQAKEDKTPPLLKRPAEPPKPVIPDLLKRPVPQTAVEAEIDALFNARPPATEYDPLLGMVPNNYEIQKHALALKAAENNKRYEQMTGQPMSELDKSMMKHMLMVGEGTGYIPVEGMAALGYDYVDKFHADVLNPVMKFMQGNIRKEAAPWMALLREHAPSIAVLAETGLYYQLGNTGGNITGAGADMNPDELDPVVRKLINDKASFIGSDAGAAMLSMTVGFRDLPLWLIGGSSKLGLAVGGMANEVVREDGNLAKGAAMGMAFGTVLQKVMKSGAAKRVEAELAMFADNIDFARKGPNLEPLAIMTNETATKMAAEASQKAAGSAFSEFKTQVITPQAIVLDVGEDGAPLVFGASNGKYGALPESHKNTAGAPVIISPRAKDVWADNDTLRDTYQRMIGGVKHPAMPGYSIDEWTTELIPPENPDLMFAWHQAADKDGMIKVYEAGSHRFNADLLKARSLSKVIYAGPDGEEAIGLGYASPIGTVMAPDPSERIPNAIPKDLVLIRTSLKLTNRAGPIPTDQIAYEVTPITADDELFNIVDAIKGHNDLRIGLVAEQARGGNFPNGIPANAPKAPFDEVAAPTTTRNDRIGSAQNLGGMVAGMAAMSGNLTPTELGFAFIATVSHREVAKQLMKIKPVNWTAERMLPSTAYGEKFKIDAAIQAFATRHFKRYFPDAYKQLALEFGPAMATPVARKQLSDDIRAFVMGQRAMPASIAPNVQAKVNQYVNDRNADYAMIRMLGGTVPPTSASMSNPKLEEVFARDLVGFEDWTNHYFKHTNRASDDAVKTVLSHPKSSAAGKAIRLSGNYDTALGKMNVEFEMANDIAKRKIQLNTLNLCAELAYNPQAASDTVNAAMGHTKRVDFMHSGLLKGKYVSPETYNAIYTWPKEQEMNKNMWMFLVDKIKYNKTVLNPAVWAVNIAGNGYGIATSNIIPAYRPDLVFRGVRTFKKDLRAYETDMFSTSAQVRRVKEALKFGLLGAEFESTRSKLGQTLDQLETSTGKVWHEKLADIYFGAKDSTIGALGQKYSHIDTASKYALYAEGLQRWGIDPNTNMLDSAGGRVKAAQLLGFDTIATLADVEITELVKRAVARRIHLSLPMVDRAAPWTTAISKHAGVLNPWMRTALEIGRVTSQMPYRAVNESGYALNMAKSAGLLGLLYAVNRGIRIGSGISDKAVDDAMTIAPKEVTSYMPGPVATPFRASDGGIVVADFGGMMIESLQWFTGDNSGKDPNGIPKRVLMKLLDTITSGGVFDNEAKAVLASVGLAQEQKQFNKPIWKQDDSTRGLIDLATRFGPQFINNGWNLYATTQMPDSMAMKGMPKLEQPYDMQVLKMLGLDVASLGTEHQRNFKFIQLTNRLKELQGQLKAAPRQTEGSPTGKFQAPYNTQMVIDKILAEQAKVVAELQALEKTKSTEKLKGGIRLTK